MAEFSVKTKAGVSPQGKQRVYFISHPEDFDTYFEELSDDVIEAQNCAVFYDPNPEEEYDEKDLETDIKEMQLVVVCVTGRFLETYSRALLFDFECAIKNNVPILPIMVESGLEEKFNERCGCLQTINKTVSYEETLSYKERIKKYITSVLLGDEIVEKVRAAFDAYIFLSYRKKDRKKARELMELIHNNEFTRDVAIWYDEYLVIGENFNTAIETALKGCQLFTLLVTPNLLEENNYVMSTELPMAEGKPIIAAEMEKTNREELASTYSDVEIPKFVSARRDLKGALKEGLKDIALCSNNSPEHIYYIGLAYLNGIDVEINLEKGLELIKESARQGYKEAIRALIRMYNKGDKVSRNTNEVIEWINALIGIIDNEEASKKVIEDYLFCAENYHIMAKPGDALEILENAEKKVEKISDKEKDIGFLLFMEKYYHAMADFSKLTERHNEAAKSYEKSIDALERAVEIEDTVTNRRRLALNYAQYGRAELVNKSVTDGFVEDANVSLIGVVDNSLKAVIGNRSKARKLAKKALNIMEGISPNLESDDLNLSVLGEVYSLLYEAGAKSFGKPLYYLEKAVDIWKRVLEIKDDERTRDKYAFAVASGYREKKKERALADIDEGINVIKRSEGVGSTLTPIQLYLFKASVFEHNNERDSEKECLLQALMCLSKYMIGSKSAFKWANALRAVSQEMMPKVSRMAKSEKWFQHEALLLINLQMVMYNYLMNVADKGTYGYKVAAEYVEPKLKQVYKKYDYIDVDDDYVVKGDFSDKSLMAYYSVLGTYAKQQKNKEMEEIYLRQAINHYNDSLDDECKEIAFECYIRLGELLITNHESDENRSFYLEKGFELWRILHGEDAVTKSRIRFEISDEKEKYNMYRTQKDWKNALEHLLNMIKLREEILSHPEDIVVGDRESLAFNLMNAGTVSRNLGTTKKAGPERIAAYRNALAYYERGLREYERLQRTKAVAERIDEINRLKSELLILMKPKNKKISVKK